MPESKNEIIVYQPDETIRLEVRLENETVWLTQSQMAQLFGCTIRNIRLHSLLSGKNGNVGNRDGFPAKHTKHTKGSFPRLPPRPQAAATAAANAAAWKARFPAPSFVAALRSTSCRAGGRRFRGLESRERWQVKTAGAKRTAMARQTAQGERHALSLLRRMSRHLRLVTERLHLPAQTVCFLRILRVSREILTGQLWSALEKHLRLS